ncbi:MULTISPECIES: Tim44 domain-containing protein [unclassified Nitrosospira]|uniref:Tim44 domain-containing protein n=1 Tax=unclassified Nitrosospira TaxID=2609267 RepID=UPI000D30EE8E|nr:MULTISPECIES: Tim44-like domain-containing protein [unclassified Nitrosospira]PTR14736.1 putative lipid-binding transport protein (Tim44 family) [Nitrosospira sp. Nsp2]WON73204.1 Tim44-like domain-containing protein [Nitrosospira sp. Is2]
MKKLFTLLTLAVFSFGLAAFDAEAKRFGGGKSIGKQREAISPQAAPKPGQAPAAAAAPAAAGGSKWMGPLAGLAAGGLLAALFMGGAFEGIKMMDVLMLAALMAAIFFVVRMLRRPRQENTARPMQYSGMGTTGSTGPAPGTGAPAEDTSAAGATTPAQAVPVTRSAANIPADFQVEPFLRNAKTSFIRLQAANDARDLSDIREYTTPQMFAEISMQINERGGEPQRTEVMAINADVLEVVTENDTAIASVRFNGQLREAPNSSPEPFDEIWHVQKDLKDPDAVWLLAGIQQVS